MAEIGYDAGDRGEPEYPEQHECDWAVDHQLLLDDLDPFGNPKGECFAYCACGEELRCHEIRSRLNEYETLKRATEMLSAEDARADASDIWQEHFNQIQETWDSENNKRRYLYLIAYANILEGKNERTKQLR